MGQPCSRCHHLATCQEDRRGLWTPLVLPARPEVGTQGTVQQMRVQAEPGAQDSGCDSSTCSSAGSPGVLPRNGGLFPLLGSLLILWPRLLFLGATGPGGLDRAHVAPGPSASCCCLHSSHQLVSPGSCVMASGEMPGRLRAQPCTLPRQVAAPRASCLKLCPPSHPMQSHVVPRLGEPGIHAGPSSWASDPDGDGGVSWGHSGRYVPWDLEFQGTPSGQLTVSEGQGLLLPPPSNRPLYWKSRISLSHHTHTHLLSRAGLRQCLSLYPTWKPGGPHYPSMRWAKGLGDAGGGIMCPTRAMAWLEQTLGARSRCWDVTQGKAQ